MKMKTTISRICSAFRGLAMIFLVLALPIAAQAVTNSWTGGGDQTNWFDANNWSPVGVPTNGDTAFVQPGGSFTNVLLTNSTACLASVTISNATLTFSNWATVLQATNVVVAGSAVLTHAVNSDTNGSDGWTPDARVYIDAFTNFILGTNASINVNGKGYTGGATSTTWQGCGPGGGTNDGVNNHNPGGGGYGGNGGGSANKTYGSLTAPVEPGSGGGLYYVSPSYFSGGNGGGAVRIESSGGVAIYGRISANGLGGNADVGGAGSGGSVYISCQTIAGNGFVSVNAGNNGRIDHGSSGGGGRISVIYTNIAQATVPRPAILFSANNGVGGISQGDPGTLYFPDTSIFPTPDLQGGQVWIAGLSNLAAASMSITTGRLVFSQSISLTISNDLTISRLGALAITNSTLNVLGNLTLNSGTLYSYCAPANVTTTTVSGNMTLTNAGKFHVYSGQAGGFGQYGAYVRIGGNLNLATGGKIYAYSHNTNGGSPYFRMGTLTIADTNSGFNADEAGFGGCTNTLVAEMKTVKGFGPGGGLYGGGGGYGGQGGYGGAVGSTGGITYASADHPLFVGSGGGTRTASYAGGRGGGLLWLEVDDIATIAGTLSAKGGSDPNFGGGASGAGSGGGIQLKCHRLAGSNAVLSAKGGKNARLDLGGGGGGGRIAIWRQIELAATNTWSLDVSGGAGYSNGVSGTVFWGWLPFPGTVLTIH